MGSIVWSAIHHGLWGAVLSLLNFICFLFVAVDVSSMVSFLFLDSFWWGSCSQSKFFAIFSNYSGLSGAFCLWYWIQLSALSPIYICCFAAVFFADLRYFHMQKLTMYASILNKLHVFAPAQSAFTVVLLPSRPLESICYVFKPKAHPLLIFAPLW